MSHMLMVTFIQWKEYSWFIVNFQYWLLKDLFYWNGKNSFCPTWCWPFHSTLHWQCKVVYESLCWLKLLLDSMGKSHCEHSQMMLVSREGWDSSLQYMSRKEGTVIHWLWFMDHWLWLENSTNGLSQLWSHCMHESYGDVYVCQVCYYRQLNQCFQL
jgi:hypothetical protein